jgi:glyoxylase-like metal-dependent hydrolase (beta-lactamase superfamily II)
MKTATLRSLVAFTSLIQSCTATTHPTRTEQVPMQKAPASWTHALSGTTHLDWEPVLSARWKVSRKGLINFERPEAKNLPDDEMDIALPVHVLRHPTRGVFIFDTGVSKDLADGGSGGAAWPLSLFLSTLKPVEPLSTILARQPGPLAGVFYSHLHADHVLGTPDVPRGTPLYTGLHEAQATSFQNLFLRSSYERFFAGQEPTTELDLSQAPAIGCVRHAFDFFGDGSLWLIAVPGHTPGSLALVANTQEGPVLFTGDSSHTRWGWEHHVEPGTYTADHAQNRDALAQLASIAREVPQLRVMVGHEIEPAGPVTEDIARPVETSTSCAPRPTDSIAK